MGEDAATKVELKGTQSQDKMDGCPSDRQGGNVRGGFRGSRGGNRGRGSRFGPRGSGGGGIQGSMKGGLDMQVLNIVIN